MAGEIKCNNCGLDNKPGAILCEACNEPLEVTVGASVPTVASSSAAHTPASAVGIIGRACGLVVGGNVVDREFELPKDDFGFTIGRTDLDQGIIPDVDLTKFAEKVKIGQDVGYTVSRKQAIIIRRMGRLYLRAIGAKTMIKPQNTDWKELLKDQEEEILVGSRFRFGGSEGYVIFEVV